MIHAKQATAKLCLQEFWQSTVQPVTTNEQTTQPFTAEPGNIPAESVPVAQGVDMAPLHVLEWQT